jgi:thioredoxin reductase
MLTKARQEILRNGAEIRSATVHKIEPRADGLVDVFVPNEVITARTIVLVTGLVDELPPLTGLRKAWGRELHICPLF